MANVLALPDNTYVIGKIPGYNKNIDQDGVFATELLKGITFVDLRPMSYSFASSLDTTITIDTVLKDLGSLFDRAGLFTRKDGKIKEIFEDILDNMANSFGLSSAFNNTEMIRIIGANDSTFTETFTNDYGEENIASASFGAAKSLLPKPLALLAKGIKSYSHQDMIGIVGSSYNSAATITGSAGADILTGAIAGMQLAAPTMWAGSQYTSNLTLFIKLVSPTGTDECIKKNIIEPIMMLLAAASPVTNGGIMYGFPLLWDIHAHGITNFRIGGIAALTLIRGSFETTFTANLQPTVIDVRMTLVPLLNDFAVQTNETSTKSIYSNSEDLGVQNPGDIFRGITNAVGDKKKTGVEIHTIKL